MYAVIIACAMLSSGKEICHLKTERTQHATMYDCAMEVEKEQREKFADAYAVGAECYPTLLKAKAGEARAKVHLAKADMFFLNGVLQ